MPFTFPEPLSDALGALARERGATVFMVLLAAFQALLARYSGQEDFAVGSPVAGRDRRETEDLIGFFVNTLVLRSSLPGAPEFTALLERTRATALEAYAHQDVPFEKIVQELAPERNLSYSPLIQAVLAVQNAPRQQSETHGLAMTPVENQAEVSKFDLSLSATVVGATISGQWVYGTALFEAATIARWAGHFQVFLEALTADPSRRVSELPLLTAAERGQLLVDWNVPPADYPDEGFVHQLFESQAKKTPDAVAVVFAGEALTYRELNARANRLARRLRRLGAGPEKLVGIGAERSFEMVVGLLAILKAGAAYVPLDPSLPAERLSYMIEDAGIELLLTEERLRSEEAAAGKESRNLNVPVQPGNAAYVIYTSGSTGQPKGVVVSHRALGNRLQYARTGDVLADDAFLQKTTISFDVSILEIFAPLVVGGRTVLAKPGGQQDPAYLLEVIREQRITYTSFPPSLLYVLFEQEGFGECDSLRVVITGGETVPAALPGRFYERLPGAELRNRYGPTEATISVTSWTCEREGAPLSLPIGRPTAKARVYLLDAAGQPVPVGITGEIFLGGLCVARGYHRRPHLTAESFVPDPFAGEPGARMYRTGDLARYRPDGAVEFVGRVDSQVKIRGFRVELGEIEAALDRHPAVREVAVVDRRQGATRTLAAYLVLQPGEALDEAALRGFLLESLPAYMVPADFVALDALPLTPTGKVDRKALPEPRRTRSEEGFEEPVGPVEEILAGIFAEVLGMETVGRAGNFFDLGGHSLLATQVVARVRELLGFELPLRTLFENPVIAELAARLQAEGQAGEGQALPPIVRVPRQGDLPLSFAQERLWFIHQLEDTGGTYNIPVAVRLEGVLDVPALERSLAAILARHEVLRTAFLDMEGRPALSILDEVSPGMAMADLQGLERPAREAELRRLTREETRRPFDLSRVPLMRFVLVRLDEGEHAGLLTMHHIVSDLWSTGVFLRELSTLYSAFSRGEVPSLPELPVQYADYAHWQRSWLRDERLEAELDYWRRRLAGAPAVLELPTDRPRPAVQSFRGGRTLSLLPPELLRDLQALGRRHGATLFMTLAAASAALLSRYSSQDDVVLGTPVANRDRLEVEGLIGLFLNTLALRVSLEDGLSFEGLLERTRRRTLEDFFHQELPFEKLVLELASERTLATTPIFQVMLVVQAGARATLDLPGIRPTRLESERNVSLFDLTFSFNESPAGLVQGLEYSEALFDHATVERMASHLGTLLAVAAAEPGRRLSDLPLATAAEADQVNAWGRLEEAPRRETRGFHELFEERADLAPDEVAVIGDGGSLTYGELEQGANRLARRLRGLGVGPEVRVALAMPRSLEGVVGILAILKAGGVYVPVDPTYPEERRRWMLEDARALVVLTDADAEGESAARPESWTGPENLAYVIYTSGSTGKPKGVAVPHGALSAYVRNAAEAYGHGPGERMLQMASWSFDASVLEMLAPLAAGGSVALWDGDLDVHALLARAVELGVTMVHLTPALLQLWVRETAGRDLPALPIRLMMTGSEAMPPEAARLWPSTRLGHAPLLHCYGPTETVVIATNWRVPAGGVPESMTNVPIGRLLPGWYARVVDRQGGTAPVGVPGELLLGGTMARGYLDRPDVTAEKFVPDAFSGIPGARLYRTGDLVRWLASGDLEFLGRIDQQVKIRGFRVELGEIEAVLAAHPAVAQAAVVAQREKARLVAYFVPAGEVTAGELRDYLKERLPEFMVPSAFVTLQALPLNANGKVDRKALPAPDAALAADVEFVAPRTTTEELLAGLWASLLSVPRVGVHDNFFQLGGHSLLATQLVSRILETFGVKLPLRKVFERPTLAGLALEVEVAVRSDQGVEAPPLLPAPREGDLPLSFAQERLWFLAQLQPDSPAYNMPVAVRLHGRLDVDAFRRTLREITRRHESLRTRFAVRGGVPVQVIDEPRLQVPVVDLRALPAEARESAIRRLTAEERRGLFDLAAGPVIRATLLRSGDAEHVGLLTLHHIAADGWSVGVLIRELGALYTAFVTGEPSPLPELAVQYADFAVWQRAWLSGEVLEAQLAYWRQALQGHAILELPTDRPRPPIQRFRGADERFVFRPDTVRSFLDLGQRQGATAYMSMLAAFQALLHRYARQDDVIVGATFAGRDRVELEPMIGFFINTLAMRTDLSGRPTFRALLTRVREVALGALSHQDLPFEKLVEELRLDRDLSRSPLFQVVFQLQNTASEGLQLPGLALSPVEASGQTAKFDIVLNLQQSSQGIGGVWKYNTDLFDQATMARMSRHFENLLAGVVADPDQPVAELPILAEAERRQLGVETPAESLGSLRLHEVFAVQAARSPEAAAVTFEGETLSYGDLDRRANRIANHLIGLGILPGDLVGLRLERSLEMVAAILGVLKAGAAYVPLDPEYPAERLAFMIEDSRVSVVLDREALAGIEGNDSDPRVPVSAEHPAYVIYTSGSTGKPKGVVVTPRQRDAPAHGDRAVVRLRPGGRLDAVPLLRLRLLGLGDLGRAALRRPAGGGAVLGQPLARGVPRAAGPRAGDRAQPDAVGVPPAHLGRRRQAGRAGPALRDLRRRGAGAGEPGALVRAARRRAAAADQHVRHHRDHGARHVSSDRARGRERRGSVIGGPIPDLGDLRPRRDVRAAAGRRAGRDLRRRRGPGARLPRPAGADGGALRARIRTASRARVSTAPATWRAAWPTATWSTWAASTTR